MLHMVLGWFGLTTLSRLHKEEGFAEYLAVRLALLKHELREMKNERDDLEGWSIYLERIHRNNNTK